MYTWLTVGHLIGVILWIGCMAATYWMLRFHTQAPKSVHEKLILMERSLALAMDLGASLAIGCGIAMAVMSGGGEGQTFRSGITHPVGNLFAAKGPVSPGWFHIKLLFVIAGVLSVHGILRGKVAKFSRGETPTVPPILWTILLLGVTAVIIAVTVLPREFVRKGGDSSEKPSKSSSLIERADPAATSCAPRQLRSEIAPLSECRTNAPEHRATYSRAFRV